MNETKIILTSMNRAELANLLVVYEAEARELQNNLRYVNNRIRSVKHHLKRKEA